MMFIYSEGSFPIWAYFLWSDWDPCGRLITTGESTQRDLMLRVIGNKKSIVSHVKITRVNINSITVLTYLDKFQLYRKHFWQKDEILKLCRFKLCWDISSLFLCSTRSTCQSVNLSVQKVMSSSLQGWGQYNHISHLTYV